MGTKKCEKKYYKPYNITVLIVVVSLPLKTFVMREPSKKQLVHMTLPFKSLGSVWFFNVGCIYLISKTIITILKFFSIWIYFKMWFISVITELDFQQPLLQFAVSHNPSEIILICWCGAQETFFYYYQCRLIFFLWKLWYIFFSGFFDEKEHPNFSTVVYVVHLNSSAEENISVLTFIWQNIWQQKTI